MLSKFPPKKRLHHTHAASVVDNKSLVEKKLRGDSCTNMYTQVRYSDDVMWRGGSRSYF